MTNNEHENSLMSKKPETLDTKKKKPAHRCQWCNAPIDYAGFCDDDCEDDYELSTFA